MAFLTKEQKKEKNRLRQQEKRKRQRNNTGDHPQRKAKDKARKKLARSAQSEEQIKRAREQDRLRKSLLRQAERELSREEAQDGQNILSNLDILQARAEALKYLHRTKVEGSDSAHQAHVCVVCDCFILGTETLHRLSYQQLKEHKKRLSVAKYEEFQNEKLHKNVVKYYELDDLKGMLLSPRANFVDNKGYSCCGTCRNSMFSTNSDEKPPKFSIANGFAIGEFPTFQYIDDAGVIQDFDPETDLNEVMRALFAPTRTHGFIVAYTGGAHKSITGHIQCYEVDHTLLGGAMSHIRHNEKHQNVYCVLSGRMTPSQKQIARKQCMVDTRLYTEIAKWFINESGHKAFKDMPEPDQCPQPFIMEDAETQNNTDDSRDSSVENLYGGSSYVFSSAQEARPRQSVYQTENKFTMAMLKQQTPTLLVYGGKYANEKELAIEKMLPFAFPYGIGTPRGRRPVRVSIEACLQRYMRLAMVQFMRGDVILVMHHIYGRQLSYKSGIMTSRSKQNGSSNTTLAEQMSQISVEELQAAADENNPRQSELVKKLLKSISTSCRALGHTPEAAAFARRCCFSLQDYFGLNSIFLTVTPDDELNFRIKLLVAPGKEVTLPNLHCSDAECIADVRYRRRIRLAYPGACSLEFQNLMSILIDKLFNWDEKKQKARGPGIFGTVVAFAPADEEQGRKTLHRHMQVWIKDVDQNLRRDLFHDNSEERLTARRRFQAYVDKIMSANFGQDLELHGIEGTITTSKLIDCSQQTFRDGRHETLCKELCGNIIKDDATGITLSPNVIIEHSLKLWKKWLYKEAIMAPGADSILPLSDAREDMAAYTYPYQMLDGCNYATAAIDPFWLDERVRRVILHLRFNVHEFTHRASCFKKDCECRFLFPFPTCKETYIHEDCGENDENIITWHNIDGSTRRMAPWMIIPKRPMGCQYVNVHNPTISELFGCNTNVQVGDPIHMFYITLYNLKSTQTEDSERSRNITKTIIRRLLRLQEEANSKDRDDLDTEPDFVEGLCRMLGGMYAATSRYTVSSTMAHLLICQGGTRFKFSHQFSDLLITQLEAVLEGRPVDFRLRVNAKDGEPYAWQDIISYAYLYRPNYGQFKSMCPYRMFMKYKTKYLSFDDMDKIQKAKKKKQNESGKDDGCENDFDGYEKLFTGKIYKFLDDHPGSKYSHLAELELEVIPKISVPQDKLCDISLLKVSEKAVDDRVKDLREGYAKMALLMFYPFRTMEDIQLDGSHWKLFWRELSLYKENKTHQFWARGFDILQNIQDRFTVEKQMRRAKDPVQLMSQCQQKNNKGKQDGHERNDPTAPDIAEFCTMFDDHHGEDNYRYDDDHGHHEIFRRANFGDEHFVDARMSSTSTSLFTDNEVTRVSESNDLHSRDTSTFRSDYPMMIKFIHDSLQGIDLLDLNYDEDDTDDESSHNSLKIPTMTSVLQRNAKKNGTLLDQKQRITYETICATFLLGLVNDGIDSSTTLGRYFANAMRHEPVTAQNTQHPHNDGSTEEASPENIGATFAEPDIDDFTETDYDFDDDWENNASYNGNDVTNRDDPAEDVAENQDDSTIQSVDDYQDQFNYGSIQNNGNIPRECVIDQLLALGAKEQLVMLLTGSAGAGKTTAIKLAQQFCFEFCWKIGELWNDRTFLFTAWTGSAASAFKGITISKAAFLNRQTPLTQEEIDQWKHVRILIIDEISFMTVALMKKLNTQLQTCMGDRNKPYGGLSVIFCGDFRQLEPNEGPEKLLFQKDETDWESILNVIILLQSQHRFKTDPRYGRLLRRFWRGDLTTQDRKWLNTRVVGYSNRKTKTNPVTIPKSFEGLDACYACGTNEERNAINLGNFKQHIVSTHPDWGERGVDPPSHTIIIEASIRSSDKNLPHIGGALRNRIITTCGDANCTTSNNKHVDPALCLYVGAHVMCTIENKTLTEKVPRGNGTLCRVVSVKLKDDQTSYRPKNYYEKKVWTVNAKDVQYVELEHYPPTKRISSLEEDIRSIEDEVDNNTLQFIINPRRAQDLLRKLHQAKEDLRKERLQHRFKLEPKEQYVRVRCRLHELAPKPTIKNAPACHMLQIPINLNDATTGHKLQGLSKDIVIITSWPSGGIFTNWEYVVLSRVRTIKGLFLLRPISMTKSFKPSEALTAFFNRAKKKEERFLKERKLAQQNLIQRWGQQGAGVQD